MMWKGSADKINDEYISVELAIRHISDLAMSAHRTDTTYNSRITANITLQLSLTITHTGYWARICERDQGKVLNWSLFISALCSAVCLIGSAVCSYSDDGENIGLAPVVGCGRHCRSQGTPSQGAVTDRHS